MKYLIPGVHPNRTGLKLQMLINECVPTSKSLLRPTIIHVYTFTLISISWFQRWEMKRCMNINYHRSRTSPLKVNRINTIQPVYHTTLTFITTNVPFLLCHSRETGAHSCFRGRSRPGNDARQLLHCVACHGFDKCGVGTVFAPSRLWLGETT